MQRAGNPAGACSAEGKLSDQGRGVHRILEALSLIHILSGRDEPLCLYGMAGGTGNLAADRTGTDFEENGQNRIIGMVDKKD